MRGVSREAPLRATQRDLRGKVGHMCGFKNKTRNPYFQKENAMPVSPPSLRSIRAVHTM